ncbi:MAG: lipoyl protein ligase domain-containing protein [Vampirovibrionales bacterium]
MVPPASSETLVYPTGEARLFFLQKTLTDTLQDPSLPQAITPILRMWLDTSYCNWQWLGIDQPFQSVIEAKTHYYHTTSTPALWVLEHASVLTVGKTAQKEALWQNPWEHTPYKGAIPVVTVSRAGGWTWHGPGQWIIYPLMDVRPYGLRYLQQALLYWMKHTALALGLKEVQVNTEATHLGVWAKPLNNAGNSQAHRSEAYKIASCGLHVKAHRQVWHSYHGIALNVSCTLEGFQACNPCGLPASLMQSIQSLLK